MASFELSIIVCTYNRAYMLKSLLDDLARQDAGWTHAELVVVDNNSRDDTAAVVAQAKRELDVPVRYVFEGRQGLSHARNAGWKAAEGRYAAFLDDDCRLPEGWLRTALRIVSEIEPDLAGGPYRAAFTQPPPDWFKAEYGSHEPDQSRGPLEPQHYLSGGNLIVARKLLQERGGFDTELGMAGSRISYGEEIEILRSVRRRDASIIHYEPELWVWHLVRPEKFKWSWQIRQRWADGRAWVALTGDEQSTIGTFDLVVELARWAIRSALTVGATFTRDRQQYPFVRQYIYEDVLDRVRRLAVLIERWRRTS